MNATTLHDIAHDAHPRPSTLPMRTPERLFWLLDEYCESTTTWCSSLARNASKTSSRKLAKNVSTYVYSQGLDDLPLSTAAHPLQVPYPDMPCEVLAAWWEQRDLVPSTNTPSTLTTGFKLSEKENLRPATSSNTIPIATPRWKLSESLAPLNPTHSAPSYTPSPSAPFSRPLDEAVQPVSQAGYTTILGKKRIPPATSSNRIPITISRWKSASSTPLTSTSPPFFGLVPSAATPPSMPDVGIQAVSFPPSTAPHFPMLRGKWQPISRPSPRQIPTSSIPPSEESPTSSVLPFSCDTPASTVPPIAPPAAYSNGLKRGRSQELPVTPQAFSLPQSKRQRTNGSSSLAPPQDSDTTEHVSSVVTSKEIPWQPTSQVYTVKQTTRNKPVRVVPAEGDHDRSIRRRGQYHQAAAAAAKSRVGAK